MIEFVELPAGAADAAALRYRDLLEGASDIFWYGLRPNPAFCPLARPDCAYHSCTGDCVREIAERIEHIERRGARAVFFYRSGVDANGVVRELASWMEREGISWRRHRPPRFPLFVDLDGQAVWMVGGGGIATRRVQALLPFGADITVVSPALAPPLQALSDGIHWRRERYRCIEGRPALVVAATNCRETNRQVGEDARAAGIPVSVADRKEESTFWFPAIVEQDGLVAGLVSRDGDHKAVKQAAARMRAAMRGDREI